MRPPIPDCIKVKNISKAGIAPSGYKLYQGSVPSLVTIKAVSLLSNDYGYEEYSTINNENLFFRIEPHYNQNKGWHKGCTVYQKIESDDSIDTLKSIFFHVSLAGIIIWTLYN